MVSTPKILRFHFGSYTTQDGDGIGKNDPSGSVRSVHFIHEYYRIYPLQPRFGMVSEPF